MSRVETWGFIMIFQTAQLAEMFKLLRPTTAFSNEQKKL